MAYQSQDIIRRSATNGFTPAPQARDHQQEVAKLIDVTTCIGCKACQVACSEWNDIRDEVGSNIGVYDNPADLTAKSWTVMRFSEVKDENFTVTDFPRLRGANNGVNAGIHDIVGHHDFNFHLRQKIHHIFRATVQLGMAFLTPKAFHFGNRHTGNAYLSQRFTDVVQLEGFNNRINLFHAIP